MEKLGGESVIRSVMNIRHPLAYKRGLVQLLNIIRLTIVANLFKDNPSFAYFVTDRLFILGVIPLMEDKALQTFHQNGVDAEWYKKSIFTVAGISESSLFLQCQTPLRSAFVHSCHWHTALEDVEAIEHVPYWAVIPIPTLVLTIGAIGEDGTPMEHVYRLRIKEAEEPQKTRPVR